MKRYRRLVPFLALLMQVGVATLSADESKLEKLTVELSDSSRAAEIARQLQEDPNTRLVDVLSAMKEKSAVAKNWYLSIAQTIADKDPEEASKELTQFLPRLSEDATARYWAFTYITKGNQELRERILESMLADPSLDLRYEAVQLGLGRLEEDGELSDDAKKSGYRELLMAARLPSQIQEIAKRLDDLGESTDLLSHFGFVADWQVVGTFNNLDQAGFDVAYPPEQDYARGNLNSTREYEGKNGDTDWRKITTTADDGQVDINPVFDKEKGAIVYAQANFESSAEQDCQIRIGSPNACKVWVNGQLVISREVYHSASQIDQYVAPVKLQGGDNSILVKLCQNEQTEPWAQDWAFGLRFTDESGLAIQPAE